MIGMSGHSVIGYIGRRWETLARVCSHPIPEIPAMTDIDGLYRAILDHPDDDTPRLIYADAIEDAGESERAGFIRLQVEAARAEDDDPVAVRVRCFRGNAPPTTDWLGQLPPLPEGLEWAMPPFRRGFPADIEARNGAAAFVAHADELFQLAPVESLRLTATRVAEAEALADCEFLSRITRLEFPEGLSGPFARRVLNSPHLTRLTELSVGPQMTVPATAQALVRSRAFPHLTVLCWRDDQRRGGSIVTELTRLVDPTRLKRLDLSGNRITPERLVRLLANPALASVVDLNLSDNNLGRAGIRALVAGFLQQLRGLHLARTWPEESGIQDLVEAMFSAELRSLNLTGNNLGPSTATVLAGSPSVAELRILDLRDNRLGDAGAATLATSPYLGSLLLLDLAENGIGDAGADALAQAPTLSGLVALELAGNTISEPTQKRLRDRFGERVFL
jgi:uncharacterized protein (TIGR02996 family)